MNYFLREQAGFLITTNPKLLDRDAVFGFLAQTKWWSDLTPDSLDRALRNSLCFSLLEEHRQIGMARVITDYITYAYLCDVFIVAERRRQGLGSWMVRCVLEHPDIKVLKRVALLTHDAQTFYLGLDFQFAAHPNNYMEHLTNRHIERAVVSVDV